MALRSRCSGLELDAKGSGVRVPWRGHCLKGAGGLWTQFSPQKIRSVCAGENREMPGTGVGRKPKRAAAAPLSTPEAPREGTLREEFSEVTPMPPLCCGFSKQQVILRITVSGGQV